MPNEKNTKQLLVQLTEREHRALKIDVAKRGMTLGQWVKMKIRDDMVIEDEPQTNGATDDHS